MVTLPLSVRAVSFLEQQSNWLDLQRVSSDASSVVNLDPVMDLPPSCVAAESLQFAASEYVGLEVAVAGGVLHGTVQFLAPQRRGLIRTSAGSSVVRLARHTDAQCALTLSEDGEFGCSWADDFWPLFDTLEAFVENSAAWASFLGWHYSIILDELEPGPVVQALGTPSLDADASGQLSQWWRGPDFAIVAERYLNPKRSAFPQISVLADGPSIASRLREQLKSEFPGSARTFAARTRGIVGR